MAKGRSTTDNPAENDTQDREVVEIELPEEQLSRSGRMPAFVQYIGGAHVRKISAADWKNVDVQDQGQVVWDKRKFRGDRVPVEQLSQGALEYCATFDSGFRLLDEDGKPV